MNSSSYLLHLCQPNDQKSCGACCGLYNWKDHSRKTLESLLGARTAAFEAFGKDPDLARYRRSGPESPSNPKLLETIYNCEFLGFLDGERKRVGCLLHPSRHGGKDLREHSFYGKELCAGHFCPSFTHLTKVEQLAVIGTLNDWYLYGLVITDIDLVKEFFEIIQSRLGDCLRPERFKNREVRRALVDFFKLKESWKFASTGSRLGKYYFSHGEYEIARIEYEKKWQMKPSRFNKILVSLSSEFNRPEEVREAESMIEEKIVGFIAAYLEA